MVEMTGVRVYRRIKSKYPKELKQLVRNFVTENYPHEPLTEARIRNIIDEMTKLPSMQVSKEDTYPIDEKHILVRRR
jgi:hypothetical protein